VPRVAQVTIIWNPANPVNAREFKEAQAASARLGVRLLPVELRSPDDLDVALTRRLPGVAPTTLYGYCPAPSHFSIARASSAI